MLERRRLTRIGVLGLGAVGTLAVALVLGSAAATAAHQDKPVLTMGITNYTASLNPAIAGGGDESMPIDLAYASLTHLGPDGKISAGLASSWRYVGRGNQTFQLTLRHDARFSDGTPVTAAAVKDWMDYTFFKAKGPSTGSVPLKNITTSGKWTVVLHLKAPNSGMPYLMSEGNMVGYIGSPKAIANAAALGTHTDGAGKYIAVPSQSIAGSTYVFTPNPNYYDQSKVSFSKVVVKIITSVTTMIEAIKSGQINVAAGDITTVGAARQAGLDVISAPSGFVHLLFLDRGPMTPDGKAANPLGNVKVRQALNYAIDKPKITKAIYGVYGQPTSEMGSSDGFVPSLQNYYTYNPAKAKRLLAEAGWAKGFSFTVTSESQFGTLADPVLQAMAQQYKAIGVHMKITITTTLPQWVNQVLGGTYQSCGFIATAFPPMDVWYTYQLAPRSLENQHGGTDPVMVKLVEKAQASSNPSQYWRAVTRREVMQADSVPVFNFDAFWYTAKNIGGLAFGQNNGTPYPSEWYAK
jgi:peptide/nickel transport system substrate-binding protein